MIEILDPGMHMTLQGAPRDGWRQRGVPTSGPADSLSHAIANRLVGNPVAAAAVEITFGPIAVQFHQDTTIAVTGAAHSIQIDGQDRPPNSTIPVRRGETLSLPAPFAGFRSYLAVAGGLEATNILGSTSTYTPAGLGGHEGRALKPGDRVATGADHMDAPDAALPHSLLPQRRKDWVLRALALPELHDLPTGAQRALTTQSYKVSPQSDRMGLRLIASPALNAPENPDRPSEPLFPGAVQCPPDGHPILMGCDAQTTGGYPLIMHIARADRHRIGQIAPGETVRFRLIDRDSALTLLAQKKDALTTWCPTLGDVFSAARA